MTPDRAFLAGSEGRPDIRVALLARDRRFLKVASFLLSRNGYGVESTHSPRRLLPLVEEADSNVVVVDGSGSSYTAAQVASALSTLPRDVGLVVVADDPGAEGIRLLDALPKWGFDELLSRIRRVHDASYGDRVPRVVF